MSKPKNWPSTHRYLTAPQHSKSLTESHIQSLRTTSPNNIIPASSIPLPSPNVKIQRISNPLHPAHNQSGLFAARDIARGEFILPYLGEVHSGGASDPASDYDLWIDRALDLAVDASAQGNEARFVNDYRGVRERPNAEFRNVFCERWGEVCVGVWAIGGGGEEAVKKRGIKKGEEILVSYGKGFWEERKKEDEAAS